jgi:hypothetical protein
MRVWAGAALSVLAAGARRVPALAGAILVSGCFSSLTAERPAEPPDGRVDALAVGEIRAPDVEHQRIARQIRRELVADVEASQAFARVLLPAPAVLPPRTVLLSGELLEAEDGSEALRFLIGPGVGAPRLRARYELHTADGLLLARFVQTAHSMDGAGYAAHWNPVYLDDIAADFAAETADAIVAWSKGGRLE